MDKDKLIKHLRLVQGVYKKEMMVVLVIDDIIIDIEQGEFNL